MNEYLRRQIVQMVMQGKDGHIPSAFSIVEILNVLYGQHLQFDSKNPDWSHRDYFILSKGHGCLALYAVLQKHGFITEEVISMFCRPGGVLGEHPDCTKVPGIEASTGSLGHGLPFAVGIAQGLRMRGMDNRVFVLVGDGECHEGTVWEAANVGTNLELGRLCVIVDWNGSGATLMPHDDLPAKWQAFGWDTTIVDGHSEKELDAAIKNIQFPVVGVPTAIIAKTVKGKGVAMLQGHGKWHHRIPNEDEFNIIMEALS
ncbi:MAG: transketolase [Chloroflexota bacterium]|nr:transketolase [Chloroflexota bacterium]